MKKIQTNLPDLSGMVPVLPDHGPRPRALYSALRRMIEAGQLRPGTKLPPTRELAAQLQIARGAVVTGYETLIADGFAVARVGAGTFVADAVPRVGEQPAPVGARFEALDLPGDLGLACPDPVSLAVLRRLINRTLARPPESLFHYADPRGGLRLRTEVAEYLRMARGLRLHEAQVILTSGTQGALDLIARAVLAPGDRVWMEDPGYPSGKAALSDQTLIPVPVDAEGVDVAEGIARAPDARAAYVTPSHQFPLGVVMSMRRRLDLLAWAERQGAWIIEDDYDSEFRFEGAPLAALQGMDGAGRVIYIGTYSKALMPGLRVGYMVLPMPLVDPVLSLRRRIDRAPPGLIEPALAEFLASGGFAAHLRRARRRVRLARDALVAELTQAGLPVTPPDQGLHLTLRLPEGSDDLETAARARTHGFGARALSAMYLGPKRPGLVIGYSGHPPEVLSRAARRWLDAANPGDAT